MAGERALDGTRLRAHPAPRSAVLHIAHGFCPECRSAVAIDRSSMPARRPGAGRILGRVSTFSPALAVVPTYNEARDAGSLVEAFERDAPASTC